MKSLKDKIRHNYAVDLSSEEEGIWVPFDGFELKIRRANSPVAQAAHEAASRPFKFEIEKGKLSDEDATKIGVKYLCYGLIADWRGEFFTEKKKPVPFSKEACMDTFGDEDLKDLQMEILSIATDGANYKIKNDEEEVGN
jgi:hypothetical protein